MRVLTKDNEVDERTDEEFIHDQLSREPTEFAKGKSYNFIDLCFGLS